MQYKRSRRWHPRTARPRLKPCRLHLVMRAGGGDLPPRQDARRRSDRARPQPEHLVRCPLVEGLGRRVDPRLRAVQHAGGNVEGLKCSKEGWKTTGCSPVGGDTFPTGTCRARRTRCPCVLTARTQKSAPSRPKKRCV